MPDDRLRARRALARLLAPEQPEQSGLDAPPFAVLRSVAIGERVVPILADAVARDVLPADDTERASAAELWDELMNRCLRLEARLAWLSDELAALGIDLRVLKGPASAHLDHLRPELRQFGDLDVLVRAADMPRVFELLEQHGYVRRYPEPRRGFDQRFTKSVSFRGDVEIDVHRTLAEGPVGHGIRVDDLWERASTFHVAGVELRALAPAPRFVHACLHAHLAPPPARLSTVSDIARGLVGSSTQLDEVIDLARRWHVGAAVERAVLATIAEIWWPDAVDPGWSTSSTLSVVDAALLESHRQPGPSSASRAVLSLATLPGLGARVRYVTDLIAPRPSYAAPRHGGFAARLAHARRAIARTLRRSP